ncbi:MAG: alternative ribosome rescue aminoacyl-tRNA hydrolase ArfB [Ekhidna sp.]
MTPKVTLSQIKPEIEINTSRSGGAGGQHVNKVETKVTLRFNVKSSEKLSDRQKDLLSSKLADKLTKSGDLIVYAESTRSQLKNKEIAFKKLDRILTKAFHTPKPRKKTKPGKAAIEKRIKSKKMRGETKKMRKKVDN